MYVIKGASTALGVSSKTDREQRSFCGKLWPKPLLEIMKASQRDIEVCCVSEPMSPSAGVCCPADETNTSWKTTSTKTLPLQLLWVCLAAWGNSNLCLKSRCSGEVKSILHQRLFIHKVSCIALNCWVLLGLSASWGVIFITSFVWLTRLPLPLLVKPAHLVLDVSHKAISRGWALTPTHLCVTNCFPIYTEENQVSGKIVNDSEPIAVHFGANPKWTSKMNLPRVQEWGQ